MPSTFPIPLPLPLPLPKLSEQPLRHHDCCLALSTTLILRLRNTILDYRQRYLEAGEGSRDLNVVSVGSGTGFLEALLQRSLDSVLEDPGRVGSDVVNQELNDGEDTATPTTSLKEGAYRVFGIEVPHTHKSDPSEGGRPTHLNKHLPVSRRVVVEGTWDVWDGVVPAAVTTGGRSGRTDDGNDDEGDEDNDNEDNNDDEETGMIEQDPEVQVHVLLFIYPRQPSLLRSYVTRFRPPTQACMKDTTTTTTAPPGTRKEPQAPLLVIWAGPRSDWEDYQLLFQGMTDVNLSWGQHAGVGIGEGLCYGWMT